MGWYGEVRSELQSAAKRVDAHPRHTLGWLEAAQDWNRWAWESVSDANDWDDTGLPAAELPKNCDWVSDPPPNADEPPTIYIPNYDPLQVLRLEKDSNG